MYWYRVLCQESLQPTPWFIFTRGTVQYSLRIMHVQDVVQDVPVQQEHASRCKKWKCRIFWITCKTLQLKKWKSNCKKLQMAIKIIADLRKVQEVCIRVLRIVRLTVVKKLLFRTFWPRTRGRPRDLLFGVPNFGPPPPPTHTHTR